MGDIAGNLDGETKTSRRRPAPFFETGWRLKAIEGGIDLYGVEMGGKVGQVRFLGKTLGEELLPPFLICPTRSADVELPHEAF